MYQLLTGKVSALPAHFTLPGIITPALKGPSSLQWRQIAVYWLFDHLPSQSVMFFFYYTLLMIE